VAIRRCDIFDALHPGVYHCISRCVRREALLSSPERRGWLVNRLEHLSCHAGIDVISFAIMSNHLHLLLRNRPDVVAKWSDHEVARRRLSLLPNRRARMRRGEAPNGAPSENEIGAIIASPKLLARARRELSDLGFFHRLLKEPCARAWNREDGVTGHFWEGRFLSPPVLDGAALLRVARYIELNEVRAKAVGSIPASVWTSARRQWQRLRDELRRLVGADADWPADALSHLKWSPVFRCDPTDPGECAAAAPDLPLIDYILSMENHGRAAHPAKPGRITSTAISVVLAAREAVRGRGRIMTERAERLLSDVRARVSEVLSADSLNDPAPPPRWRVERPFGSCHAGSVAGTTAEALRRGVARVIPIRLLE